MHASIARDLAADDPRLGLRHHCTLPSGVIAKAEFRTGGGTPFLLSFSLPDFYATTTYDILPMRCAPIGKLDYLGKVRSLA